MILNRFKTALDRLGLKSLNENMDKIEKNFNGVVDVVANKAYNQVVDAAKLIWQEPVDTFTDLATTYPVAQEGWASMTRDTGIVYRYNSHGEWKPAQEISAGPFNEMDHRLTTQLAQMDEQKATKIEVNKKADSVYVDGLISGISDASPRDVFYSYAALETAYPSGAAGTYLVYDSTLTDGAHSFIWSGAENNWKDLGLYQANTIADESIEPKHTTFMQQSGVNLFNKDDILDGYHIRSHSNPELDGQLVADNDFAVSGYIKVKSHTDYSRLSANTTAFYDAGKSVISVVATEQFTTPPNTAYVRLTVRKTNLNIMMFNEGAALLSYEPYTETLDLNYVPTLTNDKIPLLEVGKIPLITQQMLALSAVGVTNTDFIETGVNLFNKDDVLDGYYIRSHSNPELDGQLVADANFVTSSYIKVKPGDTINRLGSNTTAFYDINESVISVVATEQFTVPVNTVCMRLSVPKSILSSMSANVGTTLLPYEPYELKLKYLNIPQYEPEVEKDMFIDASYRKIVNTKSYEVYEPTTQAKVAAIYKDIAVKVNAAKTELYISQTGVNGEYNLTVVLNVTNFKNLKANSTVERVLLIPWSRNKETRNSAYAREWRMVVITNNGQIYHNFPSRATTNDGTEQAGDITRFDQSVVWDSPERKYPSNNPTPDVDEMYYPGLPTDKYVRDVPVNEANYGNSGFPKYQIKNGQTFPRFYTPRNTHSLAVLSGFDYSDRLAVIGTYRVEVAEGEGIRFCVFVSDDGGRQWYNRYEFANVAHKNNWGNDIDSSTFSGDYVADALSVRKRNKNMPSATNKEPATNYTLGTAVNVSAITKGTKTVVTTATAHGLTNGDIIVFKKDGASATPFDWLANDSITAGTIGNGKMFRCKVLSDTTFELKEHVHSWSNQLPCVHIHAVTKQKDGFIVGTGEGYPDSWVIYMQHKRADMYGYSDASNLSQTTFTRLTSSDKQITRTLGVLMLDDTNNTIIWASDEAVAYRPVVGAPEGRTTNLSRNSMGLFKTKLADIDDMTLSECILEVAEPIYHFREINGIWVVLCQRGEFAISFDQGQTWSRKKLNVNDFSSFAGANNDFICIDGVLIGLKL